METLYRLGWVATQLGDYQEAEQLLLKVIEVRSEAFGAQSRPVAGTKLGDLGADVIKVEPLNGDPGRGFMRIIGTMVGIFNLFMVEK